MRVPHRALLRPRLPEGRLAGAQGGLRDEAQGRVILRVVVVVAAAVGWSLFEEERRGGLR